MPATTPFSYSFADNPMVANVRLLIPDTVNTDASPAVFNDDEIQAFYNIQASQFQSSMFFSGVTGRNLPSQPLSYLRVAALAVDTLANNASLLAGVTKLLDVNISNKDAAAALAARAAAMRTTDDESGAFVVIEQCPTVWSWMDRWYKQVQRQQGGGGIG